MHIVDVTDPSNTTVTGVYVDPNTQVLDVKYLVYNNREYVIVQNQLVDPGAADPNVGEWGDPAQVTVTLVDVTDKYEPTFVDAWYDADHPSGPHNLYTHMIDNEWYIFVANPDYESCDIGQGDACGGITVAHLNFAGYGDLPRIVKVGEAEVSWETTRGGWIYIHDMTVQTWPGDDSNDAIRQNIRLWGILGSRIENFRCIRCPASGQGHGGVPSHCSSLSWIIRDAVGVQLESSGSRAMDGLRGLRWRR